MNEEIKNLKDIKQILASVLEQVKTWVDANPDHPIQNDINEKDVANTQLDPSRIDSTKPGGAGNHTKEDKFDFMTKQMTAVMNACMAMADMMDTYASRLNYHRSRMDEIDNKHSQAMSDHKKSHLPPAPSTEHMAKAIKALGWSGNYEVAKKTVYANKDLFEVKKTV
jgi:hypothetical protein